MRRLLARVERLAGKQALTRLLFGGCESLESGEDGSTLEAGGGDVG